MGMMLHLPRSRARQSFSPRDLFVSNAPGVWFAPSDTATLFQDGSGALPVTALEQPVGLMLDKSRDLALGPELVDTANSAAAWTPIGTNTVTDDAGAVKITYVDGANGAYVNFNAAGGLSADLVVGRWYKVTCDVKVTGSVTLAMQQTLNTVALTGATPEYTQATFYFTPNGAATPYMRFQSMAAGEVVWVKNISVKHIAGSHAYQSTVAARPTLTARYNAALYGEEFSNVAWLKTGLQTITANAVANPLNGALTADLMVESTATSEHLLRQTAYTTPGLCSQTLRVYLKPAGRTRVRLTWAGANLYGAYFTLADAGSVDTVGASASASITALADGWYLCQLTFVPNSNTSDLRINLVSSGTTYNYAGDGASGVYIWGVDLRATSDFNARIPMYQRVSAANDYDTVGFPRRLRFDGVDDSMQTAVIDWSSTNRLSAWVGVRKVSDATMGIVFESGTDSGTVAGTFAARAPGGAANDSFYFISSGTAISPKFVNGYAAPSTVVLSAVADIAGDSLAVRVNGSDSTPATADQGTGNYTAQVLYLGSRAGTGSRLWGAIHGLLLVGATATASQLSAMEAILNLDTKAY